MASFRCYDSSDVIAILIMTNFPLYLIQLWWQFFPNACLWRRSLCSNLAGIDSEKLYRATFICQYGLFCCMALVSFRLFCKNLGNLRESFGQMDYRSPPPRPWPKIARTPIDSDHFFRDPWVPLTFFPAATLVVYHIPIKIRAKNNVLTQHTHIQSLSGARSKVCLSHSGGLIRSYQT